MLSMPGAGVINHYVGGSPIAVALIILGRGMPRQAEREAVEGGDVRIR
jgi:hypothetical protein